MRLVPSLKSIAEEIGVSITTVSNALNNKGKLGSRLRKQIVAHARRRNYQPSPHARVLHGGRLKILGMMIGSLHDGLAQGFFMGADRAANEFGYSTILSVTAHAQRKAADMELEAVKHFDSLRIGGVLYLPIADAAPSRIENLFQKSKLPFVLIYRRPPQDKSPSVVVDHRNGIQIGLRHLMELHHRRIGIVYHRFYRGPELDITKAVFQEACPGLEWEKWSASVEDLDTLLAMKPTAIFAMSDDAAASVADTLADREIDIPNDISLVGFRDTIVARSMRPKLTTVHVPADEIGYAAAKWLVQSLEAKHPEPPPPIRLEIPPQLVVRQSTCMARN